MSTSLITQDFFGKPVAFHDRQGSLWISAEEAAPMLGLKDRRSVSELFRDHKIDFLDGHDVAYATLDVATSGNQKGTGATAKRRVLIFSLTGLELLALLVRNEVGRRARRWTVDLRASLRAREKVIVDPAKLAEKVAVLEAMIAQAHANHHADMRAVIQQLLVSNESMASALGSALAQRKHQKAHERALQAEFDIGQQFLPGINGDDATPAVNRLPEN